MKTCHFFIIIDVETSWIANFPYNWPGNYNLLVPDLNLNHHYHYVSSFYQEQAFIWKKLASKDVHLGKCQ